MTRARIAIVVQRWAENMIGGSEALAWQYANLLKDSFDVDLITTTALDVSSWKNELKAGTETRDGIRILRFQVDETRTQYWHTLYELLLRYRRMVATQGAKSDSKTPWPIALQEEWIRKQGPHSEGLLNYLSGNSKIYQNVVFVTYLYSHSYFGTMYVPRDKSILVPALHDEPAATMDCFSYLARRVKKLFWNTKSEMQFAETIWGKLPGRVVSMGIPEPEAPGPSILNHPYILYSGRIESGKGCDFLFENFLKFATANPSSPQLILIGKKEMKIPASTHIKYLGFLSEKDKFNLMKHARCLCMPSPNESLSLVTLESLMMGTPVLVNGLNPVLAEHIDTSKAGLKFRDAEGFALMLKQILSPEMSKLGETGPAYVRENYSISAVQEKLIQELKVV